MLVVTSTYRRTLDHGLILRAVEDREDVERLAAFNGQIHGPGVAAMTHALILEHPATRPEHWLFVEEESSRTIVSALCLLPWTLRYGSVSLRAGEMGIVGTLAPYRGRGLVRALNERFSTLLGEGGYLLSHIQGIPYFYRQFGYDYAMPLEAHWRVELDTIVNSQPSAPRRFHFRPATVSDIPLLTRLYRESAALLDIAAERDEEIWPYLLGPSTGTAMVADTWLALDESGPAGYFRVAQHGFGSGLIVNEASRLSLEAAEAVLYHLKSIAVERQKPYIRLNLPANSLLVELARWRGCAAGAAFAWQLRIPDPALLLTTLAPVLEQRLAASHLASITHTLRLNLYRSTIDLRFDTGKLAIVAHASAEPADEVRLPPPLLAPLVTGYRTFDELARTSHDVSADGPGRALAAILFPPMQAFLYTIY
jgi:predicted acetyltransferase